MAAMFALSAMLAMPGLQGLGRAQQAGVTAALTADPPVDPHHPARLVELTVPSHGSPMNAVFYLASGAGPHPVVLLLHGFPGNEQNLDLAQAMRRAGWSVLTLHYRGSWGSPGAFSFSHAIEDTDAAVAFLRDPAVATRYSLDPKRIVLIGHSMGGFLALHAASTHPELIGVAAISAWNIGGEATAARTPAGERGMTDSLRSELAPLVGCTAESLFADAKAHASAWNFVDYAAAIGTRPALFLEADDGLAEANAALARALRQTGNQRVTEQHLATDHSFSDHRIALESVVLTWLGSLQ
ncbi:MAG TPA: alpha/beta fold hydrolase [Acidobacteriaceae bacterium]